jgi:phytoene dehydrogenase-like protein
MKYDCVIIGAGLSGLAAGIRLARFDKKVCICERHSRVGGLNSYYYRHGILLESGLHAMTNFTQKNSPKSLPLPKLLRQLKIKYDDLAPRPQNFSLIKFPNEELRFENDFAVLENSIADKFPSEIDGFRKLDSMLDEFDEVALDNSFRSTRKILKDYINSPLLTDMLLCPLMYYGSSTPNDMDFSQFAIMYKSIYKQGFCRPAQGIKGLLDTLQEKFLDYGGTLKMNCAIDKIITSGEHASGVLTKNGDFLEAEQILSSAGAPETESLFKNLPESPSGEMAFIETIAITEKIDLSHLPTVTFFSSNDNFRYQPTEELADFESGVICVPSNFKFESGDYIPPSMLRTTVIGNPEKWHGFSREKYDSSKQQITSDVLKITGDISKIYELDSKSLVTDTFTPATITRFTDRRNGAVYGSPQKYRDGLTDIKNLYLCGTDQGFLGITGSLLSGISIANLYLLK